MEFIMILSASLIIGLFFITGITYFYTDQVKEKNMEIAKEIVVSVENELFSAAKVRTGFIRNFNIPQTINNQNYSINIEMADIILIYDNIDFYGVTPNVTGNLQKGVNTIKNIDGKIYLN